MANSNKPGFFRPVEIGSTNYQFKVYEAATWDTYSLDQGVYGSLFSVLHAMHVKVLEGSGNSWNLYCYLQETSDFDIRVDLRINTGGAGGLPDIDLLNLEDLLGSDGTETRNSLGSNIYNWDMTYRPSHCWIPTYMCADQGRFVTKQKDLFTGSMSQSGAIGGNTTMGSPIYYRTHSFVNEPAENICEEGCTNSTNITRHLEYFAEHCRTAQPSDSTNPTTKGFFYVADMSDIMYPNGLTAVTSNGGIHFDYSSSPDKWVYCQLDVKGPKIPEPALPVTRARYNVELSFNTDNTSIDWTYDTDP